MKAEEKTYEIQDQEGFDKASALMPDQDKLEQLGEFFKIMGDPTRLKVLISLEHQEFCASDLASLAGMSRSAISHQLKALKAAKLIKSRRDGKTVFYSLDDDHIYEILKVAFSHMFEEHQGDETSLQTEQ